jgi:peptidoglycan/xylan/chitin deacetylase (PgdA/CDA1 family)
MKVLIALLALGFARSLPAAEPVPDKLVVLTFDDSVASQANYVAPLLKEAWLWCHVLHHGGL